MFRAPSLLSFLLLALSVTGSLGGPAASAQPGVVSLPVKAPVSIAEMVKRDAARRAASGADSEGSLDKRQAIPPTTIANLANYLTGFSVAVGIGSPVYEYDLLLDTVHPDTWAGADQPYTRTSTTVNQGTHETVTYARGSYTGYEVTDKVTLSTTAFVTGQRVDVALTSSGFEGYDGVLGLGPGSSALPSVLDNLYSQGKISTREFGLGLLPSSSPSGSASVGVLTLGGTHDSQYLSLLDYATTVTTPPYDTQWAVYTWIYYAGTEFATHIATTIDSLSPYIFLNNNAYNSYVASTGATLDTATGLLKLPISAGQYVESIEIQWGATGDTYSIPPDAQIWPTWANGDIGGDAEHLYLLIQNGGGAPRLGLPFLQRFYLAFDADTSKVGIARTSYTNTIISYPPIDAPDTVCDLSGHANCPPNYSCDIVGGTSGVCTIMPTVAPNDRCFDGVSYYGPCGVGYTCQEVESDYWICRSSPP